MATEGMATCTQPPPPYSPRNQPTQQGQQYIQPPQQGQQYIQPPQQGQQFVQPPQQGQQQGQQYVQPPQQGQQYVQQFVQQNPHGFVQSQPPTPGFSDISGGYGYTQQPQMPPPVMNTTSTNVVVCQPQTGPTLIVNPAPYSYMTPAVLSCFFCCWLIGIGAIVAAAMSQSQSNEMQYDEARKSANIAKILTIVTFCCGIACYVIIGIVSATAGG